MFEVNVKNVMEEQEEQDQLGFEVLIELCKLGFYISYWKNVVLRSYLLLVPP